VAQTVVLRQFAYLDFEEDLDAIAEAARKADPAIEVVVQRADPDDASKRKVIAQAILEVVASGLGSYAVGKVADAIIAKARESWKARHEPNTWPRTHIVKILGPGGEVLREVKVSDDPPPQTTPLSEEPPPQVNDPFRLRRFEIAQDEGGTYAAAVSELRVGRKVSHWMWFVFPQISGLGQSSISTTYAITSLAEAEAYLQHHVLGPRLIECTRIFAEVTGRTAQDILGATDAMKLRSSMTLFAHAAPDPAPFQRVLNDYFGGVADASTERRLACQGREGGPPDGPR